MSDKIIMKGLIFYAFHGVLENEQILGQKFIIDLELYADLKKSGISDNLNDTINYEHIYKLVAGIVTERKFCLIEALAEKICTEIGNNYPVKAIKIKIKKPQAPINGIFKYIGVELYREFEMTE